MSVDAVLKWRCIAIRARGFGRRSASPDGLRSRRHRRDDGRQDARACVRRMTNSKGSEGIAAGATIAGFLCNRCRRDRDGQRSGYRGHGRTRRAVRCGAVSGGARRAGRRGAAGGIVGGLIGPGSPRIAPRNTSRDCAKAAFSSRSGRRGRKAPRRAPRARSERRCRRRASQRRRDVEYAGEVSEARLR